jgi:hypothetical protein
MMPLIFVTRNKRLWGCKVAYTKYTHLGNLQGHHETMIPIVKQYILNQTWKY